MRRQPAGHLGGVNYLGNRSGVRLIGTNDKHVSGHSGGLAVGVGDELGVVALHDGEGVGAAGWLGGWLACVKLSAGLGVRHAIVGDGGGEGPAGGARDRGVCSRSSRGGGSKNNRHGELHG